jgi:hypothetical protein
VPSWPRTIIPFEVTSLDIPGPLISKSQSGRVTLRGIQQLGRTWTERYLVNVRSATGRELLATTADYWRNGDIFTIDHRDHLTPLGAGGGAAVVGSQFRQVWRVEDTPSTFTDETTDANSAAANDWLLFPAGAGTNDYVAVGFPTPFGRLSLNIGTAGAGTYTVTWEYWNGSAWAALSGVTDNTNAFKTTGTNNVTFTVPPTWVAHTVNGSAVLYYVRARRDAGTVTTDPLGTQGFVRDKQFGRSLPIDAGPASVTNWLRAGDIFTTPFAPVREAAANVTTNAAGQATIPINPPIFTGGEPGDGDALTITGVTLQACILEPPTFPTTNASAYDYGELTVTFSETL